MGMDRPHTQEAIFKHHPPGAGLESIREEESWETKTDLEEEHWGQDRDVLNDIDTVEEDRPEPGSLEEFCCGPMLLHGARGISHVSQSHVNFDLHMNEGKSSGDKC